MLHQYGFELRLDGGQPTHRFGLDGGGHLAKKRNGRARPGQKNYPAMPFK
jgi:hypothetical protein